MFSARSNAINAIKRCDSDVTPDNRRGQTFLNPRDLPSRESGHLDRKLGHSHQELVHLNRDLGHPDPESGHPGPDFGHLDLDSGHSN